ncbi:MAG: tRNA (adenosine(37)-N6)-threonylcarbamoyltransferase complex transferase subunit TsaD [Candidatus Wildermuthbacteria bacterium]|nr:tRNA (adenosine(37)-N6)-threonylcarbamoyltransferase complex transferase subunit TsaD [Candidatus Wildermuthbacteria bacterium]
MKILGIETSCDDTCIAVLEATGTVRPLFNILAHAISSQTELNKKYGGVYPNEAKRAHKENLPIALSAVLSKARLPRKNPGIRAIAVTYGPGLSPCLWEGVNFAKDLARSWNIPLVPANHMEGHLLCALLKETEPKTFRLQSAKRVFPAIALLVSGGHTQIIVAKAMGEYKVIGETRDDAAGEAFDKTARILGLGYPGGPAIAKAAMAGRPTLLAAQTTKKILNSKLEIVLPRPMMHTKDFDFSFSGLKTAVLYKHKETDEKTRQSKEYIQEMAREIQQAIADVLIVKTMKAAEQYGAKSILLGGGVSANQELRTRLQKSMKERASGAKLFAPSPFLCTDNGIMPAVSGYFLFRKGLYPKNPDTIEAQPNVRIG